jgi:hypothetical protein
MNLEDIVLSEISYAQKDEDHIFSLIKELISYKLIIECWLPETEKDTREGERKQLSKRVQEYSKTGGLSSSVLYHSSMTAVNNNVWCISKIARRPVETIPGMVTRG